MAAHQIYFAALEGGEGSGVSVISDGETIGIQTRIAGCQLIACLPAVEARRLVLAMIVELFLDLVAEPGQPLEVQTDA